MDQKAIELYKNSPEKAIEMLSNFYTDCATKTWNTWKELDHYLVVRYTDGNIKKEQGIHNNYVRELFDKEFDIPKIEQPGYDDDYYRNIVKSSGDKNRLK